jgi:tetratricopeptide (TPR) repeat protein
MNQPMSTHIEDLKRRLERDPSSIAFAQLAEQYRRAGRYEEAIVTCRDGLSRHPAYLSARMTLGRSLAEIGRHEEAVKELGQVLHAAPDNLTAMRLMADSLYRSGQAESARAWCQKALALAPGDAELQQLAFTIAGQTAPAAARCHATGGAPASSSSRAEAERLLPVLERWLERILAARQGHS